MSTAAPSWRAEGSSNTCGLDGSLLGGGEESPAQHHHRLADLGRADQPERHRQIGELRGVPVGLVGGGDQPGGVARRPPRGGRSCAAASAGTSSTGASITTSTAYFQPIESCSSRRPARPGRPGRRTVRGAPRPAVTRSTRSTRRASLSCDQPSTYHRRCRTTTAHGSSSMSHSRSGVDAVAQPHPLPRVRGLHEPRRSISTSGTTTCQPRAGTRRTASAGRASGSGSARTILPRACPTGSSSPAGWPSSTAITRPSASVGVNISGGSRSPRPTR